MAMTGRDWDEITKRRRLHFQYFLRCTKLRSNRKKSINNSPEERKNMKEAKANQKLRRMAKIEKNEQKGESF